MNDKMQILYAKSGATFFKMFARNPQKHILLIPGWGESLDIVEPLARDLSNLMHANVYIPDFSSLNNFTLAHKNYDGNLPETELIKVYLISKFLRNLKLNPQDFICIAHSEGALVAAKLTQKYNFKYLILVAPAGILPMGKRELFTKFINYFVKNFVSSIKNLKKSVGQYYFKSFLYFILNPIQLIKDAYGIAYTDIVHLIKKVSKETNIYIFLYESDSLFDSTKMKERLQNTGIFEFVNLIKLSGDHASLHTNSMTFINKLKSLI